MAEKKKRQKRKRDEPEKKLTGVYKVVCKSGVRYGIDYYHPVTGQRIKKIIKGATSEAEAEQIRGIELADARRHLLVQTYHLKGKDKPVLFEDMAELYLKWAVENKKDPATDSFRSRALVRAFKSRVLTGITPFVIEQFKTERCRQVAKQTVNKELYLLRQVFDKAIVWEKLSGANPCDGVKGFKVAPKKKPGMLTAEQVLAIRDQVKHPVKRDMIDFAFCTGWRIGEIRKLKWNDVELDRGTAWIVDPKNRETVEIELNDKALAIIGRQKDIVRVKHPADHVFAKINGDPFRTNLDRLFKHAAERAGVELPKRKRWHILRRTWASLMLQGGTDIETLRVLGNWKRYDMPLWYAEAAGREKKKELLNRNIPDLDAIAKSVPVGVVNNREEMKEETRVIH